MKGRVTTVTRKGQITIPAEIRRMMGLQIGDHVVVYVDERSAGPHANLRAAHSIADATFGTIPHGGREPGDRSEERQAFIDQAREREGRIGS